MQGTPLSSAWSATGLVVSGVPLASSIFTPSFSISSVATSAARDASNRDEFFAGTDPRRPDAPLALILMEPDPDGVAVLQWPASAGRSYEVLGVEELGNPDWQVLSSNIQPAGGTGTFRVDTREGRYRFFRVRMKP